MTRHEPSAVSAPLRQPRERRALIRAFALVAATLIGLYVCFLLAVPFIPALTWSLTIAVLTAPFHRRIERTLKHPSWSAAISVLLLGLLVILPLAFLGQRLLVVLSAGIATVQQQLATADWRALMQSYPPLAWIGSAAEGLDLTSVFGNVAGWVSNLGATIVRESVSNAVIVLLTFYLLFYFLRDRREILAQVKTLSPFTDSETDYLFARVCDTIHGIFFGTIVTAAVQGTLGGLVFWVLGLPNPLFWGVMMGLFALVPVLGAFVVWVPAVVYLGLSGAWLKAALLALYGSIVISMVDNILHPVLASGRLQLHTVPALISIIGGLILFGASGLVLGPLAVTMTVAILQIWRARSHGTGMMGEKQA